MTDNDPHLVRADWPTREERARLGFRIRTLRQVKGWSQMELGYRSRVSPQRLSKFERGKLVPSLKEALQLRKAFGITLDDLLLEEHDRVLDPEQHETMLRRLGQVAPPDELALVVRVLKLLYLGYLTDRTRGGEGAEEEAAEEEQP